MMNPNLIEIKSDEYFIVDLIYASLKNNMTGINVYTEIGLGNRAFVHKDLWIKLQKVIPYLKLNNLKMLVVQPVNVLNMKNDGKCAVAIDAVGAGQGEIVLVVGGSSARQTEVTTNKPVDATINAIVDYIEIEGKLVYDKLAGDADYAKAQMAVKA